MPSGAFLVGDGVSIEGPSGAGANLRCGGSSSPSGPTGGGRPGRRLSQFARSRVRRAHRRGALPGRRRAQCLRPLPLRSGPRSRSAAAQRDITPAQAAYSLLVADWFEWEYSPGAVNGYNPAAVDWDQADGFDTPEEAAASDFPPEYVRISS